MPNNDLNPCIVDFVITKYYKGYKKKYYEDLYSYGLQALYEADAIFDTTKNTQPFKYFATGIIRRAIYGFVRDRITKTYQNTAYTDNSTALDVLGEKSYVSIQDVDLYRAIATLTTDEKELLYLIYNEEYSQNEVSKMKHVHPNTIMRHHAKIINKLKELLKVYEL